MNDMLYLTEDIKSRIKKLHIDSIIKLSLRCALYALPLIAESDKFNILKEQDKQNYLLKCFNALGISINFINALFMEEADSESGFVTYDNSFYGNYFFVPQNDIEYIIADYKQSPTPFIDFLTYAIELRRAISTNFFVMENTQLSAEQEMTGDFIHYGMEAVFKLEENLYPSIFHIVDSSIGISKADNYSKLVQDLILEDISIFLNKESFKQYSLIPNYGDVWNKFIQIFHTTGWLRLITSLYENNFMLNNKELNELKERV